MRTCFSVSSCRPHIQHKGDSTEGCVWTASGHIECINLQTTWSKWNGSKRGTLSGDINCSACNCKKDLWPGFGDIANCMCACMRAKYLVLKHGSWRASVWSKSMFNSLQTPSNLDNQHCLCKEAKCRCTDPNRANQRGRVLKLNHCIPQVDHILKNEIVSRQDVCIDVW